MAVERSGLSAEQRMLRARLGGLAARARHDGLALTEKARATYIRSFLAGHSCSVCPPIWIPADLPASEVARRALALRRAHFTRLALRRAATSPPTKRPNGIDRQATP